MPGSRLIQLIQQQSKAVQPSGIELGTVISPPPTLSIRLHSDSSLLQGDDLIICEHLIDHEITYSTAPTVSSSEPDDISHLTINDQTATIKTRLAPGDTVAVLPLPGDQQYLVIDKVVVANG